MATMRVEGLAESVEALSDMEGRLQDLRPVLEVIGQDLRALVDDSFENEAAPDGTPWAALTEATITRKRAFSQGDGGFKILQESGTLRGSINTAATATTLEVGSNVPYSTAHQLGTGRLPARPFLPFEETDGGFVFMERGPAAEEAERIREAIALYIAEGRIL